MPVDLGAACVLSAENLILRGRAAESVAGELRRGEFIEAEFFDRSL